nr:CMT1A duplicated region transcript 4 protein homolog [Anolis sagrei ordinatus]
MGIEEQLCNSSRSSHSRFRDIRARCCCSTLWHCSSERTGEDSAFTERSLVSGNIGIPPHLIHTCKWPAYTTYTSPVVKKLVEEDKLKIEAFLGAPRRTCDESHSSQANLPQRKQSLGFQETIPDTPRISITVSPSGVRKDSAFGYGGSEMESNDSAWGPSITKNLVIFSKRRVPLRVLPMKLPDVAKKRKAKQVSLQE